MPFRSLSAMSSSVRIFEAELRRNRLGCLLGSKHRAGVERIDGFAGQIVGEKRGLGVPSVVEVRIGGAFGDLHADGQRVANEEKLHDSFRSGGLVARDHVFDEVMRFERIDRRSHRGERLVCDPHGKVDVVGRHRRTQEHVVPRVHVDTASEHGLGPGEPDSEVRVVSEQDLGHLHGTGLAEGEPVGFGSLVEARPQAGTERFHVLQVVRFPEDAQRLEASSHRDSREPERPGHVDARCSLAACVGAE